jgi:hypothetical protein
MFGVILDGMLRGIPCLVIVRLVPVVGGQLSYNDEECF